MTTPPSACLDSLRIGLKDDLDEDLMITINTTAVAAQSDGFQTVDQASSRQAAIKFASRWRYDGIALERLEQNQVLLFFGLRRP